MGKDEGIAVLECIRLAGWCQGRSCTMLVRSAVACSGLQLPYWTLSHAMTLLRTKPGIAAHCASLETLPATSATSCYIHSAVPQNPRWGTERLASLTKITKINELKVVNRGVPSSACTSPFALILLIQNIFLSVLEKSVSYLSRPMSEC